MKRLCVFYRLADRFLGNKKIEWIVCKECQQLLIRGEKPKVVWQKVHKMNAVTDCSACDGDDLCIVCHKAPATVPDRNTVSLKKRLCAACHQARLRDDILHSTRGALMPTRLCPSCGNEIIYVVLSRVPTTDTYTIHCNQCNMALGLLHDKFPCGGLRGALFQEPPDATYRELKEQIAGLSFQFLRHVLEDATYRELKEQIAAIERKLETLAPLLKLLGKVQVAQDKGKKGGGAKPVRDTN